MKIYFSSDEPESVLQDILSEEYCLFTRVSRHKNTYSIIFKLRNKPTPYRLKSYATVFFLNENELEDAFYKKGIYSAEDFSTFVTFFSNGSAYFQISEFMSLVEMERALVAIHDYGYQQLFNPSKNYFKNIVQSDDVQLFLADRKIQYTYKIELKKIFNHLKGKRSKSNISEIFFSLKNMGCNSADFSMNLRPQSISPSKCFALIGKNGVGKSRALKAIKKIALENLLFSKVIAINVFKKRRLISSASLAVLNTEMEVKSSNTALIKNILDSIEQRYFFDRRKVLRRVLEEILEGGTIALCTQRDGVSVPIFEIQDPQEIDVGCVPNYLNRDGHRIHLSQGQEYLLSIILHIFISLEDETLILIDEPEVYLHPNYLVFLISLLEYLSKKSRSTAILSTHSVFVARELPRENVHIMRKIGREISMSSPSRETFGGSLDRLAEEIFYDGEFETRFQSELRKGKLKSKKRSRLPADILSRIISND